MTGRKRPFCDGPVLVAGAGPAGLAAAYELSRRGMEVVVLEQEHFPGGIARTSEYRGFRFDIGGHRFFTKYQWVSELWHELLGEDFLVRPRCSRIFCKGRFFDYPLNPWNVLTGLGIVESTLIVASYLARRLNPTRPEVTLADWVANRFGSRLFELFFRSYTEKVWGVSCREIGAQWAAQRIRGLSLRTAVANMFRRPGLVDEGEPIRTLIGSFSYPRLGPGMMWEALCREITRRGGEVRFGARVERVLVDGKKVVGVEVECQGKREVLRGGHLISTMPLRHLVERLIIAPGRALPQQRSDPVEIAAGVPVPPHTADAAGIAAGLPLLQKEQTSSDGAAERAQHAAPLPHLDEARHRYAPEEVLAAARNLRYRDFLTVALIVGRESLFPDNWIYVHEESLRVGRIQNFGNWSPDLVPEPGTSCLGMEYFCFEGDELWKSSDAELVALATRELEATGLVPPGVVREGVVVRVPKAYPMYDEGYQERVALIRDHLSEIENLQAIGRNGMHKYNNMDHSMLTGLLAVRNLCGERHDIWGVNVEDEYHESDQQ